MKLVIYENISYEDAGEKALFDLDENLFHLKGDYYHDKIDHQIEGYLQALSDFNIYTDEVDSIEIDSDHEHFGLLGFYTED